MTLEENLGSENSMDRRNWVSTIVNYSIFGGLALVPGLEKLIFKLKKSENKESISKKDNNPISNNSKIILQTSYRLLEKIYSIPHKLPNLYTPTFVGLLAGHEASSLFKNRKMNRRNFLTFFNRSKSPRKISLFSLSMTGVNRTVDIYSTREAGKRMQDPRFEEYGFNQFIMELSPRSKSNKPPNFREPNQIAMDLGILAISYFIPTIGFALGAMTPTIYLNNMGVARTLDISYAIGDKIKEMLANDATNNEISTYLNKVRLEDLNI
ncbi:hypothetical protein GOV12_01775 [Candidatus Pacearchaeota archaeon]|nr:hypothetical protein [Candidatus Pacearchaeota archaeon]